MDNREEQYYKKLQIARLKDKARKEVAGKMAGKAAVAAAKKFYGIGYIPGLKTVIKKAGEGVGKTLADKPIKKIIIIVALLIILNVIAYIASIVLIAIIAYIIFCYSPAGMITNLLGGGFCS